MKNFNKTNIITGWILFLVSLTVYLLSLEPTVSLWDCGEFIASAYKLQIGHPPGAPIYMLIARFFSLFAGNSTEKVALMVNALSAFASAFTIMFLYWTIVHLISKLYTNLISQEQKELQLSQKLVIVGGGITGSLTYAFSDTFWFSAVEAEVYALSSLFTAIVFWAILKWENEANEKQSNRWIILIAYLMGLSIGVHLLNLLAIPAIVMVYYFKKHVPEISGIFKALLASAIILGGIMYVVIPGFIWLASKFELLFVNGFGLPYKSGVLFYLFLLITSLAYGLWKTSKNNKVIANTILLAITVILIGYSSFSLIVIRSMANPPMNENNPQNVFSLLSYLNREQYGNRPLFRGQYFNAKATGIKEGKSVYSQIDGKYVITNNALSYVYDPEYITVFPRMWNSANNHIDVYINWSGLNENKLYEPQRDANGNIIRDSSGNIIYDRGLPRNPPGFFNNLRFFLSYQIGHMYLRYFMWNFSGRQNDIQADGGPLYGNWISGLDIFDKSRTGSLKNLPDDIKNIPSRNTYYLIPLLLGIAGMIFQYKRDVKNFWVVGLLFILTGIAIVVYLNQTPLQPRERDYAYAGSFYAFSIWIGMAVPAVFNSLKIKYQNKNMAFITGIICILIAPGILAVNNHDDHNRSGRYTARDIAYNYLITCAPNAILFTNGDNDTFPLWYAQEVEGIRTDVRVVNLMLLNMDWYIDQMKRRVYDSDPLPISLETNQYRNGTRDRVYIQQVTSQTAVLNDIIEFIASDNMQTKVQATTGDFFDYIPTRNLSIPVDSSIVLNNGTVKKTDSLQVLSSIDWTINSIDI